MRTGPALGRTGNFHEAGFYGSDAEFLSLVVPFFAEGLAAGEPVVSAFAPANQRLVREAFGPGAGIRFVDGEAQYLRPAVAIRRYQAMFAEYVAAGVGQIRVAGDVPHPGVGAPWDWWARYEAAVNHAYDEFPLRSMCAYDTRSTPRHVLDDVARTHPRSALPDGGHPASEAYVDPRVFLADRRPLPPDLLTEAEPRAEMIAPTAGDARQAVRAAAPTALRAADLDEFLVAVSEIVTNAARYGRAPARMRVWADTGRMIVEVTDGGGGPKDPFAGLLPAGGTNGGGLGLWITHQICDQVALAFGERGFTVRLGTGRPA